MLEVGSSGLYLDPRLCRQTYNPQTRTLHLEHLDLNSTAGVHCHLQLGFLLICYMVGSAGVGKSISGKGEQKSPVRQGTKLRTRRTLL